MLSSTVSPQNLSLERTKTHEQTNDEGPGRPRPRPPPHTGFRQSPAISGEESSAGSCLPNCEAPGGGLLPAEIQTCGKGEQAGIPKAKCGGRATPLLPSALAVAPFSQRLTC